MKRPEVCLFPKFEFVKSTLFVDSIRKESVRFRSNSKNFIRVACHACVSDGNNAPVNGESELDGGRGTVPGTLRGSRLV